MGSRGSKTNPVLEEPWRKYSWEDKQKDLDYVKNKTANNIRVLIYGPNGSGKSSFISSVATVLRGRLTFCTLANATTSGKSFTKKYGSHKIFKEDDVSCYPFVFSDTMGLEEGDCNGIHTKDIELAIKGHMKDNYTFNSAAPLKETDSPSPNDRVHVLVCVLSANSTEITDSILQKMKDIREAASDLGIPQLVVVSKIDLACEDTDKNLRNVFKSRYIKEKIMEISSAVGPQLNCIFPVKNYSEELKLDYDTDALILTALRQILDFGDDFINKEKLNQGNAE